MNACLSPPFALQVNNKLLMGLFHEEIVASLRNLPLEVCLVCARRVTPKTSTEDMSLRGTIVDNMHVGRTERAFASRVSELAAESLRKDRMGKCKIYSSCKR